MRLNKCSTAPLMCVSLSVFGSRRLIEGSGMQRVERFFPSVSRVLVPLADLLPPCSSLPCFCERVLTQSRAVVTEADGETGSAFAGLVRGGRGGIGGSDEQSVSHSCYWTAVFTVLPPGSVTASRFVFRPQNLEQKQSSCLNVFPCYAALWVSLCLKFLFWRPASAEHS